MPFPRFFLRFMLLCSFFSTSAVYSQDDAVPQIWQMLDYLATDYAGAVEEGVVINTAEYAEMQDFSQIVAKLISELSTHADKATLTYAAQTLVNEVNNKAAAEQIAEKAHLLADALLQAYPMPTSPVKTPDLAQGQQIYQSHCAVCHGVTGNADGVGAANLDPQPIAFTDVERANQRSPLSLYQTVTQGVEGTSMAGYQASLNEDERWAVAFYASTLAYIAAQEKGRQFWRNERLARAQISDLDELSRMRANQLGSVLGEQNTQALLAYLRASPQALEEALHGIPLARGRLQASVQAYQQGDVKNAVQLVLSAYLDGVEPVEPLLNAHNKALRAQIELAMGAYRTALGKSVALAEIQQQAEGIDALLVEAQGYTQKEFRDGGTVFVGAFTILLREGLEALLVIVAILAFLNKTHRRKAKVYIHLGWVSAFLAGVFTWAAARYFIDISGASRELTEGFSALFAALMLLSVGLWMHQKSIGNRWQVYIQEKVSQAMDKRSLWLLFLLAFVSVYREVFETILFYAALWTDGQGHMLFAGVFCAVAVLAVVAFVLLRTSQRLPIATFFSASSILLVILVIVLTGNGVSALQEAGVLHVSLAPMPTIDWLGIYPTWETSLAQLSMLLVIIAGFIYNKRANS